MGSDDLVGNAEDSTLVNKFGDKLESSIIDQVYTSLRNDNNFFSSPSVFDGKYKGDKAIYSPTYSGGQGAIAIGSRSVAAKDLSTSLGSLSFALAERSTAVGVRAFVAPSATGGTAMGEQSRVFSSNSVAIGNFTEATEQGTVAYGYKAYAVGDNSIALGNNIAANAAIAELETLKGIYTNKTGTDFSNSLNSYFTDTFATQKDTSKTYLTIGGQPIQKSKQSQTLEKPNNNAIVLGNRSIATGENDLAIGYGSLIDADNSLGIGSYNYIASTGSQSVVFGINNRQTGDANNAIVGLNNVIKTSSGDSAIIGSSNTLGVGSGASIIFGSEITIGNNAYHSVAIGNKSKVGNNAQQALAIGVQAESQKTSAMALGNNTLADLQNSVALGYRSQTLYFYNESDLAHLRTATTSGTSALGLEAYAPVGSTYKPTSSANAGVISVGGWIDNGTIGTRRIINLAPGALDSDAATVGQLRQLESVQKEANMVYIDTKTGAKVSKAADGNYYPLDQYNMPNTSATAVSLENIAIAVKDLSGNTIANVDVGNNQQAANAGTQAFAYDNVAKGKIEAETGSTTRQGHQAINGAQFNQLGKTLLGLEIDDNHTGFKEPKFTAVTASVDSGSATVPTTFKGAIDDLITAVNKGITVNSQKMDLGDSLTLQGTTDEIAVTTSTSGDPTITVALADKAKKSLEKAGTALQLFKYKAGSTEKTIDQTTNTLEFADGTNTTAEIDSDSKVKFNLKADLTGISSISQGNTKGTGVGILLKSDSLVLSGPTNGATLTLGANAITANSKKVTGLANGLIKSDSTDAITGKQLYSLFIDPSKVTTDQTDTGTKTINEQAKENWRTWLDIGSSKLSYKANGDTAQEVSLTDGLDFTNGTNTTAAIDADGVVKFNLSKDITLGTSKTDTGSLTIHTSQGALSLTNAGKITGLQDGEISSTSKEAVNGSQLKAVADLIADVKDKDGKPVYDVKKLTFTGDSNPTDSKDYYTRGLGETVAIKGHTLSSNDKIDDYVATNVVTQTTKDGGISILFAKTPTFEGIKLGDVSLTPQAAPGSEGLKLVLGKVNGAATDYVALSGLANGAITSTSTEAVTGQQLHTLFVTPSSFLTTAENNTAKSNWKSWLGVADDDLKLSYTANKDSDKKKIKLTDGLDFTNGTNTTASVGADGVVKFNLNSGLTGISSIYQGSNQGTGAGFALTSDALTMQSKKGGTTLTLDSNGVTVNSKITGVTAGSIANNSSDAINGSQLWKALGFDPDTLTNTGIGNTGKKTIADAIAYLKEGFKIWTDDKPNNNSGNTNNNGGTNSNNGNTANNGSTNNNGGNTANNGGTNNNGGNTANNVIPVPMGSEVGMKGDGRNTSTRVVEQNGKKAVEISLNDQVTFGNEGKDGKTATDGKVTIKGTNGITIEIDSKTGAINIVGQDSNGQSGTINIASQKASAKIGVTEATNDNAQLDGAKISRVSYQSGNGGGTAFNPQPIQIATMNDGLKFTTDSGEILKTLNQTVSIVGGQTGTDGAKNIETVAKDGQIQVKLKEQINLGSKGMITAGKIAINKDGRISGLADGKDLSDAVTVRQLAQVHNETKQDIVNLNKRVNQLTTESRAGIAGAMAIAGLQTSAIAGRTVVSVGTATFKGENAVAIGISKISDNGRLGIRISGMSDSNGDRGGAISVGYGW
ncbi:YadA-like family protein [Gallibacterium genomosp. 3]|uniref:Autotransporter adhesin n=1 Tax=Gallibacterium genomosp. 3 TaxID=505345 RepID=A0A1A7PZ53_9PAST|nr:YadA-like family protein [Gallibacterium genomosp. 3]OBX07061.1 hypothetical protein QV07_07640 [Gallibacterium genomosp. 3]